LKRSIRTPEALTQTGPISGGRANPTRRSAELATENRLRRRLAGFAEQIVASLDDLDTEGRRRLLRLVIEKVRVTGWRVEIHLKIPLPDEPPPDADSPEHGPPGPDRPKPGPAGPRPLSTDMGLRSDRAQGWRQGGDLAADVLQHQCSRSKYVALIQPALPMVAIERLRATYFSCELEALEEGDQLVRWLVAAGLDVRWCGAVKCAALEFHVGVHVLVGRGERLVPEP
jgi:hypothetical protein